jgi:hypothetical protein
MVQPTAKHLVLLAIFNLLLLVVIVCVNLSRHISRLAIKVTTKFAIKVHSHLDTLVCLLVQFEHLR